MNEEVDKEIYKDYMHNQFAKIEGFDFNDLDKLKQKIEGEVDLDIYPTYKEFFQGSRDIKILELGSGFGRFPYFCNKMGYKDYTGVDLSKEGISICKKLFPDYKFIEQDFNLYLEGTQEKFDIIFFAHVLEHIKKDNIPSFLESIKNRLNENGLVIITVPNASAYFGATAGRYIDYTHEIAFTPESLEEILIVKKFNIVKSKNIEVNIPSYKRFLHNAIKTLFEFLVQSLGYKKEKIYTQAFVTVAKK